MKKKDHTIHMILYLHIKNVKMKREKKKREKKR